MTTEQKAAHTPGPWEVLGDGFAIFGGAPSHMVARCNPIEDEPSDEEWAESLANTQLVAAAPDLLAALEALVAVGDGRHPDVPAAYALAAAALAKARGES